MSIGFGISDATNLGIAGSGVLDVSYKLPIKKMDLSIGMRLIQVFNIHEDFRVEHSYGLYGLTLSMGKTIS